ITRLLEKGLKKSKLKRMDRLLGAGFGVLKAALVAGAVLMIVTLFAPPAVDATLAESRVAGGLLHGLRGVVALVPEDYKAEFNAGLGRIRDAGEQQARKALEDGLAAPEQPVKRP